MRQQWCAPTGHIDRRFDGGSRRRRGRMSRRFGAPFPQDTAHASRIPDLNPPANRRCAHWFLAVFESRRPVAAFYPQLRRYVKCIIAQTCRRIHQLRLA
jgi:hypothetical protein